MLLRSQLQSLSRCLSSYSLMDTNFAFMVSVHCPIATDQIAARFPLSVEQRFTYCLICSLNMSSSVSLRPSFGGDLGFLMVGAVASARNRDAKSSENLYVLFAYCDRASTVLTYCLLSPCSSKQPKVWPFMPSVAPLKALVRAGRAVSPAAPLPRVARLLFRFLFLVPRPRPLLSSRVPSPVVPPLPAAPGADVSVELLTEALILV